MTISFILPYENRRRLHALRASRGDRPVDREDEGGKVPKESRSALWAEWVLANSIGELIGLGLTFALGAGLFACLLYTSDAADE